MTLIRSPIHSPIRSPIYSPLVGKWGISFSPASLFAGSGKGAWYDPGDLSTMFQSGTRASPGTPVTADGDLVGLMLDKSGNNNDWVQTTGTLKPVYKTSGGLRWLKYDGLDDFLSVASISLTSGMSSFVALDRVTDTSWVLGYASNGDANRTYCIGAASASNSYGSGVGSSPTMRVNAAAIGATRQNLLDACPSNTPVVFTAENLNLSTWTSFAACGWSSFEFGGRIFGLIVAPNASAADRNSTERWLAAKAGITF